MEYSSLLLRAFERRSGLFGNSTTNCFRLFHGANEGIRGLTLDLYGEYVLAQFYHERLYHEKKGIALAIERSVPHLPVPIRGILLKNRTRSRLAGDDFMRSRESEVLSGEAPPAGYCVLQNGMRMGVELVRGQHTGIFLDMREVREALVPFYRGVSGLLNLFCYTGAFSVHALLNGVSRATNIDLSKSALRRARENYLRNGLVPDARDFLAGDAARLIKSLSKKGARYQLVIVDPPTFARNRKKNFSVLRHLGRMLHVISGLAPGGMALTVINTESITPGEYRALHPEGWEMVFLAHESSDFPAVGRPYLKAGLWRIDDSQPLS